MTTTTAKGEQTRRAVLAAAIARFGRDGYRATSVADIARDAGVGPTVPYAYFAGKEALFLAALDEDAAGVIHEGLGTVLAGENPKAWRLTLVLTLAGAVERHPLARRALAGLEPAVTGRVVDIPAMAELRKAVAERLRADQAAGLVRTDIDAAAVGNGAVTVILALVMAVIQFGDANIDEYGDDVVALFDAAFLPPGPVAGPR